MNRTRKDTAETLALVTRYADAAILIRAAERLISAARTAAYRGVDPALFVPAIVDSERETVCATSKAGG